MSSLQDFLSCLLRRLETAGIPYVIVGSIASTLQGEMRATQDVDILVDPTWEQLRSFVASLGEGYYASTQAAEDAWQRKSMFNVIDLSSGWKGDIIILGQDPWEREKFQRRQEVIAHNLRCCILRPEDVILSKLKWSKLNASDRQVRDAIGVAIAQWDVMDHEYLNDRAGRLGLDAELEQVYEEAHKVRSTELPDVPF
jgi:hypothetical protein